jgi:hypothetical protein
MTRWCFLFVPVACLFTFELVLSYGNAPRHGRHAFGRDRGGAHQLFAQSPKQVSVYLEPTLTNDRVTSLFAWISRSFAGDSRYDNLMLALAAIFGTNLPPDSEPAKMVKEAVSLLPDEEELAGAPHSRYQREQASLGAMGAAQWTGQWRTRPHALLDVSNMTSVDEWVKSLPRGCRRTLKKANSQNFTVTPLPIQGGKPAPHSSLAHFRCVVEHEVRLISCGEEDVQGFFDALCEAVGRYQGTTRMAGEIREYRNQPENQIIAFAHEVRKGRTIRGQWFYANDEAAKSYVWFHSVHDLVQRAIETEGISVVDLGPSGSDSFSELKEKYRFKSIDDWPAVADYQGPFWYGDGQVSSRDDITSLFKDIFRALD